MRSLLSGVERHLHSPIENVRKLGMIVAECLMNEISKYNLLSESSEAKKLKFEVNINLNSTVFFNIF
jgi:hypothetical protein